jgi:uncharacterized protein (TIGR02001 family)
VRTLRLFRALLWLVVQSLPVASAAGTGRLYPSVSVTSDYRYNGVSLSDGGPALQASLYWWRPDGFYLGAWGSSVDFDDPGGTSLEIDVYGGKHFDVRGSRFTLEAMYTFFPDNRTPDPPTTFCRSRRPSGTTSARSRSAQ